MTPREQPTTALPSWVAFLAAGLCFVGAGYLGTTATDLGQGPPLPGLAALPGPAWQAPLALVGIGVVLLTCARLTPEGARSWRLLTYPTAVVAALLACGLCGVQVLQVQRAAGTLRAAPYLEGAPLPLSAPDPLPARADPRTHRDPALPTDPIDLLPLLADGDAARRQFAVDALLNLGAEAIPALEGAVASPRFGARPLAVQTLGLVLEQQAVPSASGLTTLLDALAGHEPEPVRRAAAQALAGVRDLRTIGALVERLTPARDEVGDALEALTGCRFSSPDAAHDWWATRRWVFGPQVGRQPELAIRPRADVGELIAALRPETPSVNELLAERLVAGGAKAIPRVVAALETLDRRPVRGELAWVLARLLANQDELDRAPEAMAALLRVAVEPNAVGSWATRGLLELADPRTVALQVRAFDPADAQRVRALERITGEAFTRRSDADRWWEAHRKGYPAQLGPPVRLTRVSLPQGRSVAAYPPGAVLLLEGWFGHDCAPGLCLHEQVQAWLGETPLRVVDVTPETALVGLPFELPSGDYELRITVDGQPAAPWPLAVDAEFGKR